MTDLTDLIQNTKDALPNLTPTPPKLKAQVSGSELKSRLEWGEPALTILDVSDRQVFNQGHIMGAMSMPSEEVVDRANSSLDHDRDIYIYGETDEQTTEAANRLRQVGFRAVAELRGGLAGWKAIAGSTEGSIEAQSSVKGYDYNVFSKVGNQSERN